MVCQRAREVHRDRQTRGLRYGSRMTGSTWWALVAVSLVSGCASSPPQMVFSCSDDAGTRCVEIVGPDEMSVAIPCLALVRNPPREGRCPAAGRAATCAPLCDDHLVSTYAGYAPLTVEEIEAECEDLFSDCGYELE